MNSKKLIIGNALSLNATPEIIELMSFFPIQQQAILKSSLTNAQMQSYSEEQSHITKLMSQDFCEFFDEIITTIRSRLVSTLSLDSDKIEAYIHHSNFIKTNAIVKGVQRKYPTLPPLTIYLTNQDLIG